MKVFKPIYDETFLKPKYKWKEKKVFKFTWDYCGSCDTMFIRCPKCGNNCCNAGFGRITKNKGLPTKKWDEKTTKTCDVCNLAYEYQRVMKKFNQQPNKPKNYKALQKRDKDAIDKIFKLK